MSRSDISYWPERPIFHKSAQLIYFTSVADGYFIFKSNLSGLSTDHQYPISFSILSVTRATSSEKSLDTCGFSPVRIQWLSCSDSRA